jgi:hypothetical protein
MLPTITEMAESETRLSSNERERAYFSASHLTRPAAKERETVVYRIPDDSGCFPPGEWHFFSPCLLFGQFAARKVIPPSAR